MKMEIFQMFQIIKFIFQLGSYSIASPSSDRSAFWTQFPGVSNVGGWENWKKLKTLFKLFPFSTIYENVTDIVKV